MINSHFTFFHSQVFIRYNNYDLEHCYPMTLQTCFVAPSPTDVIFAIHNTRAVGTVRAVATLNALSVQKPRHWFQLTVSLLTHTHFHHNLRRRRFDLHHEQVGRKCQVGSFRFSWPHQDIGWRQPIRSSSWSKHARCFHVRTAA